MVKYSKLNAKLTDTQPQKLNTAAKNKTETAPGMVLKMFDGNDLPNLLLLTTKLKTKLRNSLNNNISTDINFSKAQISKLIQSEGFLGSLLSKLAGLLMNVSIPLVKNILAPPGFTESALAIDTGIQKKIHGSGTTTLIISKEEMNDVMKIVQALEGSNILLKGVTKTIKNETKEQKGGFLSMLLGTLGAISLGNMPARREIVRARCGNKKGKAIVRAGFGNDMDF